MSVARFVFLSLVVAVRAEYYRDRQGFSTGVIQSVASFTFTGDLRLNPMDSPVRFLLRPELRLDLSDAPFFSRDSEFRARKQQFTAGFGLVAHF